MDRIELHVRDDERRKRLEDLLFDRFGGLSKMYLREIVRDGKCEVNGRHENVGYRVRPNDFLEVELDLSRENAMRPQKMPLDILFEDGHLIVINKPEGMLVHPTHRDKNGTLLNALAFHLNTDRELRTAALSAGANEADRIHLDELREDNIAQSAVVDPPPPAIRPGLVHRLDKQTSGLLVVSKTDRTHAILAGHFKRKLVEKRYLALVEGIVDREKGTIDAPIGRFAEHKHWGVKHDGKRAETRFWVRERFAGATLLELEPVTGRTNQLRIHCESIGHPIVGDVRRGGRQFDRLCLHAWYLAFRHPITSEKMQFEAAVEFANGRCGARLNI